MVSPEFYFLPRGGGGNTVCVATGGSWAYTFFGPPLVARMVYTTRPARWVSYRAGPVSQHQRGFVPSRQAHHFLGPTPLGMCVVGRLNRCISKSLRASAAHCSHTCPGARQSDNWARRPCRNGSSIDDASHGVFCRLKPERTRLQMAVHGQRGHGHTSSTFFPLSFVFVVVYGGGGGMSAHEMGGLDMSCGAAGPRGARRVRWQGGS